VDWVVDPVHQPARTRIRLEDQHSPEEVPPAALVCLAAPPVLQALDPQTQRLAQASAAVRSPAVGAILCRKGSGPVGMRQLSPLGLDPRPLLDLRQRLDRRGPSDQRRPSGLLLPSDQHQHLGRRLILEEVQYLEAVNLVAAGLQPSDPSPTNPPLPLSALLRRPRAGRSSGRQAEGRPSEGSAVGGSRAQPARHPPDSSSIPGDSWCIVVAEFGSFIQKLTKCN